MTRINESHLGWTCPVCHAESTMSWAAANVEGYADMTTCNGVGRYYHRAVVRIPVFAPLPTPIESTETREDMERHAEVVVFSGHITGMAVFAVSARRGCRAPMSCDDFNTEADAVLWVVEGKLPGGAE